MNSLDTTARILVIIGALNWGLAIWGWDVASWGLLPEVVVSIVYALVALSGIWEIVALTKR